MDRAAEKRQRINDEVLPFTKKLWDEEHAKSKWYTVYHLKNDVAKDCKRRYMISEPVARDYADLAITLLGIH